MSSYQRGSIQNGSSPSPVVEGIPIEDDDESEDFRDANRRKRYDWRLYRPHGHNCWKHFRWLIVGGAANAPQTDEQLNSNLRRLARCLILLRQYQANYDEPERGGVRDQELVLREVYRDLYAGGAPIWALEPVMQKAAEGLTGQPQVNWFLLPRKAFIFSSGATAMFKTVRGFDISKLDAMEKVAIRLASFATNTSGANNVPHRLPSAIELHKAERYQLQKRASVRNVGKLPDKDELAAKILSLASSSEGLFFFVNTQASKSSSTDRLESEPTLETSFWTVTSAERELFSRLVTIEALNSIEEIDSQHKTLYSPWLVAFFHLASSAGACAIWFNGSWQDMLVGGLLSILVSWIQVSPALSKQERYIFEIVASFVVGCTAGLIAIKWPNYMCFSAVALSAVLDILQGFRVVYAIVEIMSKHTVTGGADLLEGLLFTGLIAYFLRFGQYAAAYTMDDPGKQVFDECGNGIDSEWYFLFVPLASLAWSGLFNPNYCDLPLMCLHGVFAYTVSWALAKARVSDNVNLFVASLCVSLSAGVFSRFTGRQAVGNTVSGLYVLLPGAYLVRSLYSTTVDGSFLSDIVQRAVVIGIGAWTGTILCSPTLLGTTRGLISQQSQHDVREHAQETNITMLFF